MALGKIEDKKFTLSQTAEKYVYDFFDEQGERIYTDFDFIEAGYLIKVYKNGALLAVVEPADNTVLICDAADNMVFKMAGDLFGAKRFVKLPKEEVEQYCKEVPGSTVFNFPRDREFPLSTSVLQQEKSLVDYNFYVGPEEIQKLITNKIADKKDKTDSEAAFYGRFNQFFIDKSGFTQEKIENEYQRKSPDTFVRFNNADSDQISIIMTDKANAVLGCIRATIFGNAVYISDEITQSDELLTYLFHKLQAVVKAQHPQVKIAYIRAASGKENLYDGMLHCSSTKLVAIHGPATTLLKRIAESQQDIVRQTHFEDAVNLLPLSGCAQPMLYGKKPTQSNVCGGREEGGDKKMTLDSQSQLY